MSTKIEQRAFGGPEVLELVDSPAPTDSDLASGEVLVKVVAAGVNPIDIMTRTGGGMAAAGVIKLPFTPGWDLAGTVEAVGAEVTGLSVGQRVLGMARFPTAGQAYAQYAVVPAEDLVQTPENLSDDQAAALPMAAMTAWQAFTDTTSVTAGQRVLITGAGGGVGHMAVQIAHHLGATVVAIASESKHLWLQGLGAQETVDYQDAEAMAALAGTADVVLSLAAGSRETAFAAVRPGGYLIGLGAGADAELATEADRAGIHYAATHVHTQRDWLTSVTELAANGALTPAVTQTFPLVVAPEAHRAIESGHTTGKIVLHTGA